MINYSDPSSWHPAANLFPLLSDKELDELSADIRQNGLLNPITIFEDRVLDGRNRLLACKKSGTEPKFNKWSSNGLSLTSWVISQNLVRRQLTPGQKAAVAVEAKPLLEEEVKRRLSKGYGNLKQINPSTDYIKNDTIDTPIKSVQKSVAKQFDVSEGYVHSAQKIKDKDEAVFQEVKSGVLSIPEAEKKLGFKQNTKAMVSSDSNEWYTPENYVEAARRVLGKFDLDPASCELANKIVKADAFIDKEGNGLDNYWQGKIWLNPPYGDLGPKFVARLIEDFKIGCVTEAILLVNSHSTDAKWFKPLFRFVLCFTDHRSSFYNEDGIGGSPTHGSVFVYLGPNPDKFAYEFEKFGSVMEPYKEKQKCQ